MGCGVVITTRNAEKTAAVLRQAIATAALDALLDKMADNARELGLDYMEGSAEQYEKELEQPAPAQPPWMATHPDQLPPAPPAPAQEPVAWLDGPHLVMRSDWRDRANYKGPWVDFGRAIPDSWVPALYTTPPAPAQPLTDEQIQKLSHNIDWTASWSYINFARAIEAAHGITKGNK
jgi:hypothetical protein